MTLVHLRARGVRSIRIANRSLENAQRLATELGGEAVSIEQLASETARADIVITSVGASRPIIDHATVARAVKERRGRPLFFLDIAVPRDVAPEVERLESVFVYNLDDLQKVVRDNYARRTEDVESADKIVDDELQRFLGRERHRSLGPIAQRAGRARREDGARRGPEARRPHARARSRSAPSSSSSPATRLVRRVLHEPLTAIRREARTRDDDALEKLLQRMIEGDRSAPAGERSGANDSSSGSGRHGLGSESDARESDSQA